MPWKKIPDEGIEQETIYISEKSESDEICDDLMIVVERIVENKVNDLAESETTLLLFWNATNGYIKLSWYDPETNLAKGNFFYFLELPALHSAMMDHEDKASFFDDTSYNAICMLWEEMNDPSLVFYVLDESGRDPWLLNP